MLGFKVERVRVYLTFCILRHVEDLSKLMTFLGHYHLAITHPIWKFSLKCFPNGFKIPPEST